MSAKTMLWTEKERQEALRPASPLAAIICDCGEPAIVQVDRREQPVYYYCASCEKFILVETE